MDKEELFAEAFQKVTFRDFSGPTGMYIKSTDLKANKAKRDRQIAYWQDNVVNCHLPPIDLKKRAEVLQRT